MGTRGRSPAIPDPASPPVSSIAVGDGPIGTTYDSGNGYVYVGNYYSDNVSIIDGTSLVGSVVVGSGPVFATYDSANGYDYVTNDLSANLSVLFGTSLLGTVNVGNGPVFATADPTNGYLYVPCADSNNVSVISGTTVLRTVDVGNGSVYAVYDPDNGYVYVANYGSGTVTVLNGTSVLGSMTVGTYPYFGSYDRDNGDVYVANYGSNNVSVIRGTTVVGSVEVGSAPDYTTYDSANGYVYVSNYDSANVTVIDGLEAIGTVAVGTHPYEGAYDPGDGSIYVPNYDSDNVSVLHGLRSVGSVPTGIQPEFPSYDGRNGYVYVTNWGSNNVSAIPTWFPITFTEAGLPTGTNWSVDLGSGMRTSGSSSSLSFSEPDGSYSYRVGPVPGYAAVPTSGNLTVNGSSRQVEVTFTATYPVTFTEDGLPGGFPWSVNLSGTVKNSTSTTVTFAEPNGSYGYLVGSAIEYVARAGNGTVEVDGAPSSTYVAFVSGFFRIWFNETGLPPGSDWSVSIVPDGGAGGLQSTPITWSSATDSLGGQLPTSFGESFRVDPPAGFSPHPSAGHLAPFLSTGGPVTEAITFQANTTVRFDATGLPPNATSVGSWSVLVVGTGASSGSFSNRSDGNEIGFPLPLGFEGSFTVSPFRLNATGGPSVFSPDPASGQVTVPRSGAPVTVPVHFSVSAPSPPHPGLAAWEGDAVLGGLIGAIVVVAVVAALRNRGRTTRFGSEGPGPQRVRVADPNGSKTQKRS